MPPSTKSQPPRSARLFSDPEAAATAAAAAPAVYSAYIDGASRGNPGPASYAVVVHGPGGETLHEIGKYIGRVTNNIAEYYGLIAALDYATTHGIQNLRVRSDSELLVRQMQGRYKVKSADLRPLHERASKSARALQSFRIEHVMREQNGDADRLANAALDATGGLSGRSEAVERATATGGRARARVDPLGSQQHLAPAQTHRVRAHYVKGVFVPVEPLHLPEGAEVSFDLRIPEKI
jgi:probable phosphoglycerate mutase